MTPTEKFVLAIDQGTTSTRAIIFNHSGEIVSVGQKEFTQIFPNPGWVEHNPIEIWETTRTVVAEALQKAEINRHNLAAVGITNQRETTVVWDKNTGEPVYNAIVWQDMATRARTASARSAAWACLPTFPAPRSSGSSTTSRAPVSAPRPATCSSVTPTAGSCGT